MRLLVISCLGLFAILFLAWIAGSVVSARIAAKFPPRGDFMVIQGRKVHYQDIGPPTAPPHKTFLLVHGASGNLNDMILAFGSSLPADYRLLAIDRPGHGYTERLDMISDAGLDVQAQMIADVAKARNITQAIVIGYSLGGAVAVRLALDHPDLVIKTVLIAPVTHPWTTGIAWHYALTATPVLGTMFAHMVVPLVGPFLINSTVDGVFAPEPVKPGYAESIASALVLRPSEFEANAVDVALLLAQIETQRLRYGSLSMPILLLVGDKDTVVSPFIHAEAMMRDAAPHARVIWFKGAGHLLHQTRTKEIVDAIVSFAAEN